MDDILGTIPITEIKLPRGRGNNCSGCSGNSLNVHVGAGRILSGMSVWTDFKKKSYA